MTNVNQAVASSGDDLMTPAEVARLFRVSPKTVARWSRGGKLKAVRTLGGHRRFNADEVRRLRSQANGAPVG
jgi:excisionase family DNA binding protein